MLGLTNSTEDEESILKILQAAGKEPSDIGLEPVIKKDQDPEVNDDTATVRTDSTAGEPDGDKISKIILSSFMDPRTTQVRFTESNYQSFQNITIL